MLTELDRMFLNGLKKFPNCTRLRLSYAFFLQERMKNKNKALEQLILAQKGKPAFYEQFIIYRYTKLLREFQGENNDNSDIVSVIALQNHMGLLEEYMKLSANLHKEFWAELKEEQPELRKLNIIGSRISKAVNEARDNFSKMQKIKSDVPQALKVFGTFLVNVLNDKTKGQELLKQAKELKENYQQNMKDQKDDIFFEGSPNPYVYASCKKSDQGTILGMNQLFTTFFGYSKEDIVGKKITQLIPKIYVSHHDKYMQSFVETLYLNIRADQVTESQYINEDQKRFFKHKNGYIFPLNYKVILIQEYFTLLTTFKGDPTTKSVVYFIVNKESEIHEMSAGAITYFDLEFKSIQTGKSNTKLSEYVRP